MSREILTILQEEAAEVIVAASKLLRFGVDPTWPGMKAPNSIELCEEAGDLAVMLERLIDLKLFESVAFNNGKHRKRARLRQYLQTEPDTQ
jgi:hypothetical protein